MHRSSSGVGSKHVLVRYWRAFGGWFGLVSSYTFWIAIGLTYILRRSWLIDYCLPVFPPPWVDSALSVLPNLLGFSLGGYLMWLGVGSSSFREWLHRSQNGDGITVYMQVSATFLHFVFMQIVALVIAFVIKHFWGLPELAAQLMQTIGATDKFFYSWVSPIGNGVGFFFFVYAMLATADTALGVFRISSWQDLHARVLEKKPGASVSKAVRAARINSLRGRRH